MDLTTSQYVELTMALLIGIVLFASVYRLSEKVTIAIILLMLPIQFVDSRYGTSNMVITYLVAFAFLLQGRLKLAPLLLPVAILLLSYGLSFTMSHPQARIHHVFYLVAFFGNILLFYLIYNFVARTGHWRFVLNVLLFTNAIVIAACILELTLGQSQYRLFGLEEWGINAARAQAGRIVGPFGSTHTTADYLVSQTVIIAYFLVSAVKGKKRLGLGLLVACNCMIIVATGDRGGFVGLIVGAFLFFVLFHRYLGTARTIRLAAVGSLLFVIGSSVVVTYTDFGRLYERLESTNVDTAVEDTRGRGFRNGLAYFGESPILGLGPKLAVSSKVRAVGDIPYRPYPHILIMHILATLGLVGLMAWAIFGSSIALRLLVANGRQSDDTMLNAMPKLGMLIFALFLAGELRIEFLRASFLDYQNYMFVLFGLFVASADYLRKVTTTTSQRQANTNQTSPV